MPRLEHLYQQENKYRRIAAGSVSSVRVAALMKLGNHHHENCQWFGKSQNDHSSSSSSSSYSFSDHPAISQSQSHSHSHSYSLSLSSSSSPSPLDPGIHSSSDPLCFSLPVNSSSSPENEKKLVKKVWKRLCEWWASNMNGACIDNAAIYIYKSYIKSESVLQFHEFHDRFQHATSLFFFQMNPKNREFKLRGCLSIQLYFCMKNCRSLQHISTNQLQLLLPKNVPQIPFAHGLQQCWMVPVESEVEEEEGEKEKENQVKQMELVKEQKEEEEEEERGRGRGGGGGKGALAVVVVVVREYALPYCVFASFRYKSSSKERFSLDIDYSISWRLLLHLEIDRQRAKICSSWDGCPGDRFMDTMDELLRNTNTRDLFCDSNLFRQERQAAIALKAACAWTKNPDCLDYRNVYIRSESLLTRFKFRVLYPSEAAVLRSFQYAVNEAPMPLSMETAEKEYPGCSRKLTNHYSRHYGNATPRPSIVIKVPFRIGWMYVDGCPECEKDCIGLPMRKGFVYVGYMEMSYVMEEQCSNEAYSFFRQTELYMQRTPEWRYNIDPKALQYFDFVRGCILTHSQLFDGVDLRAQSVGGGKKPGDWNKDGLHAGQSCVLNKVAAYAKTHFPPCMVAMIFRLFPGYMHRIGAVSRLNHPVYTERLSLMHFLVQIDEQLLNFDQKKELWYVAFGGKYTKTGVVKKDYSTFFDRHTEAKNFVNYLNKFSGIKHKLLSNKGPDRPKLRGCKATIQEGLCPLALTRNTFEFNTLFRGELDGSVCSLTAPELGEEAERWTQSKTFPEIDIEDMCNRGCSLYLSTREHRQLHKSAANRPIYSPISYFERSMVASSSSSSSAAAAAATANNI